MSDLLKPWCYCVVHHGAANPKYLGTLASQVFHAGRESVRSLPVNSNEAVGVLVAEDSAALEEVEKVLIAQGIRHIAIREPDAPWNGTITSIATDCYEKSFLEPMFKQFSRLK